MIQKSAKRNRARPIFINPKLGLEAAILLVAKEDYIAALKMQMDGMESEAVNKEVRKLEKFFLSPWGQLLSDNLGELIIEKCRKEARRGVRKGGSAP